MGYYIVERFNTNFLCTQISCIIKKLQQPPFFFFFTHMSKVKIGPEKQVVKI